MYFIAICDDEEYICTEIEKIILGFSEKVNLKVKIDKFVL